MFKSIKQFFKGFFNFEERPAKYWSKENGWHHCPSCEGPTEQEPKPNCESGAHHSTYVSILQAEIKSLKSKVN